MNHNAQSLVVYQFLKDDTQHSLDYWQGQPESEERTANMKRYAELMLQHSDNYARVMKQAQDDGDDLKDEILKVLDFLELIIKLGGGYIDEKLKAIFTALINAARKLLEIIK